MKKGLKKKPMVCPKCNFQATQPEQIELHHADDTADYGPKKQRNPVYYQSKDIEPQCANCHSLEHRNAAAAVNKIGAWHKKSPKNLKYKNPSDVFISNCPEDHVLQKNYFLKWHLKSKDDYKCAACGVVHWGPDKKLLCLDLHHIDGNRGNSLITNLELLCPNCHKTK